MLSLLLARMPIRTVNVLYEKLHFFSASWLLIFECFRHCPKWDLPGRPVARSTWLVPKTAASKGDNNCFQSCFSYSVRRKKGSCRQLSYCADCKQKGLLSANPQVYHPRNTLLKRSPASNKTPTKILLKMPWAPRWTLSRMHCAHWWTFLRIHWYHKWTVVNILWIKGRPSFENPYSDLISKFWRCKTIELFQTSLLEKWSKESSSNIKQKSIETGTKTKRTLISVFDCKKIGSHQKWLQEKWKTSELA